MSHSNVKLLMIAKMARDAIPAGGGFSAGMAFLTDPARIRDGATAAKKWVDEAIAAVRSASDPNPWREATDEDIAGEILRQMDEREGRAGSPAGSE